MFERGIILPRAWWAVLVRGILAIVFGILAFIWPRPAIYALLLIFGIFLAINGVVVLIRAFSNIKTYPRWWLLLIRGTVEVGLAVLIFAWPGASLTVLVYFIGAWAIIIGLFDILDVITLWNRIRGKVLLLVGGIIALGFGTLIFLLPDAGELALIWLIAAFALFTGIVTVVFSLMLRRRNKSLEKTLESA